ncbi:quinohemoprotein amine dehydrogenase subunit alpha [Burkholderia sp. Ax-1719]|uniref:quinohemoprotein amine dehydrogenase subunit alpha n=1 Tax=Burkholderia sp. Ax-1719 TaxID=2608334 RepID=UPI001420C4C7|nr:quinohemoprotein amine dehydrogenase subunit alpha [Burkholderia sp. Ax-1719]NIE65431.1 quinohemoprotein amine dehydrogenase subunit alpha [Burkholderia sp. Ax-1719]
MNFHSRSRSTHASLASLLLPLAFATQAAHAQTAAQTRDAPTIISQTCAACHSAESKDTWSRISHQRKTPEGWLMTIARMQTMHGLVISDEDKQIIVKYLADRQGLAPAETADARYALERRLNTQEVLGSDEFKQMCARCHSAARPLLQRRPVAEWDRLVNFHLGQWPSIEYSAMGRDRDWLNGALKDIAPMLAQQYPYESAQWAQWQKTRPKATSLAGAWSFAGHMPGRGDAAGVMTVTGGAKDSFKVTLKGHFADGGGFDGSGTAVLYDGYEWRASIKVQGVEMHQVLAATNGEMKGRMFDEAHDERGLDFDAAKLDVKSAPRILAVQPAFIKAGESTEVTVVGANLQGTPDFGPGVKVNGVLARSAQAIRVRVTASGDSAVGTRTVSLDHAQGGQFAVYRQIKDVKVVPEYAVARIGGNGGPMPKIEGRFDAEAWGVDAAGQPFRIGVVPAKWSVEPFNDQAKDDRDVKFSGAMQAATGVFTPGDAGPNPARRMSTNNTGNLNVIAAVDDAGQTVTGKAHLIVAVQRWNNPPIP